MTYQLYQGLILDNLPQATPLLFDCKQLPNLYIITSSVVEATPFKVRTHIHNSKDLFDEQVDKMVEAIKALYKYVHTLHEAAVLVMGVKVSLINDFKKVMWTLATVAYT